MTLTSTCHTPWADSSDADAPKYNVKHGGLTAYGKVSSLRKNFKSVCSAKFLMNNLCNHCNKCRHRIEMLFCDSFQQIFSCNFFFFLVQLAKFLFISMSCLCKSILSIFILSKEHSFNSILHFELNHITRIFSLLLKYFQNFSSRAC